jgi:hypothetical protein
MNQVAVTIPRPREVSHLDAIASLLDKATHEQRVDWIRSLGRAEQLALYALAAGNPVRVAELVRGEGVAVHHHGKNGLVAFTWFEKRFAAWEGGVVGYNHPVVPGWIRPAYGWITGPGHFTAYDSPEVPGEVWIDYRTVPTKVPPSFPPLMDNEHGLRALIFGDMVDVLRRVSRHVFIGDSFKARYPRKNHDKAPLLARIGGMLPTAPFVLCQDPPA